MAPISQILKKGVYVFAAVALAGSTVAFKSADEDLVWFEVSGNTIQTTQDIPGGPSGNCQTEEPTEDVCAAAFMESDLDANGHAPTSSLSDSRVQDEAYNKEP